LRFEAFLQGLPHGEEYSLPAASEYQSSVFKAYLISEVNNVLAKEFKEFLGNFVGVIELANNVKRSIKGLLLRHGEKERLFE
jgi:hypothetical protein